MEKAFFTNDAIVFGILMLVLAIVFKTASLPRFKKFYSIVPTVLLCYFIPSLLNSAGIISGQDSQLYSVASRYLLPACLVLLTISTDFQAIHRLGGKALIVFLTGTLGVVLGGPIALLIMLAIAPDMVRVEGIDQIWPGLTTIAGSWIGGSANQAAMKEVFQVNDKLFSIMVTVDIVVANFWMAFLLYGAGISAKIDRFLKADSSVIAEIQQKIADYQASIVRIPQLSDVMMIGGVAFGCTALSHWGADLILPYLDAHKDFLEFYGLGAVNSGFFWIVVIATTLGLGLSFTNLRQLEGVGASQTGSLFIYILVATIGMQMDIMAIFQYPGFLFIGIIWMTVHITLLLLVAWLIKAPFFFVAVGSQANIGGAASAPIIASAFHPSLAPVGVLLAVLGYALGTYGGILCGYIMQAILG